MKPRAWAGVLVFAFALRALVALAWLRAMPMVSDAKSYLDFALELLSGDAGRSAYYWPPGNSIVIAGVVSALGPSLLAVRLAMIALGVGGVALTALLARELMPGSDRRAAWIAALYAPAVLLAGQSYAQHLSAFCLAATAYFGARALRRGEASAAVATGFAFGLGVLTRPSMASVGVVLFAAWIAAIRAGGALRARVLGAGAAFAVVAAMVTAPAVVHNARLGAGATISTNNERNFFLGNNPYTPDYKTSHLGQREVSELEPETRAYLESFYARQDARAAMQHEAIAYIAHHPLVTGYRTLNRATSFWGFDYLAARVIQEDRGWSKKGLLPLLAIEAGSYVAVMALALVGLFAAGADAWTRRWLVGLALAYELPYTIAFSGGTYHFPVVPLVVPFAALALDRGALATLKAKRGAQLALVVLAAIQIEYAYYSVAMAT